MKSCEGFSVIFSGDPGVTRLRALVASQPSCDFSPLELNAPLLVEEPTSGVFSKAVSTHPLTWSTGRGRKSLRVVWVIMKALQLLKSHSPAMKVLRKLFVLSGSQPRIKSRG